MSWTIGESLLFLFIGRLISTDWFVNQMGQEEWVGYNMNDPIFLFFIFISVAATPHVTLLKLDKSS